MELKAIFERLRALGLARTQNDFSVIYLGKSQRYFSSLLLTGRSAPAHIWVSLIQRLERVAQVYRKVVPHKAQALYGLAEQARLYIELGAILTAPTRRRTRMLSRKPPKEFHEDNCFRGISKQVKKFSGPEEN